MRDPNKGKARKVKEDLQKWAIKEDDLFSKKLTKASKLASVQLQRYINGNIKGGATPFTQKAVGFQFRYDKFGSWNRIYIRDAQAAYLGDLIDDDKRFKKFVPIAGRNTNKFGNIIGLRNFRNLIPVKQMHNGRMRTILIKPSAKGIKRFVAVQKEISPRKTLGSWKEMEKRMINNINRVIHSNSK